MTGEIRSVQVDIAVERTMPIPEGMEDFAEEALQTIGYGYRISADTYAKVLDIITKEQLT